ncbi:MAG: DUF1844 domain-containing protein [bacterium]
MESPEKKIDQDWKETAKKEKEALNKNSQLLPEANFNFFVTTLAIQASIAMGIMENPVDGKKEENLPQARFLIDTLILLRDKTKGNLTPEETTLLENVLYELRMSYIGKTKGGS